LAGESLDAGITFIVFNDPYPPHIPYISRN